MVLYLAADDLRAAVAALAAAHPDRAWLCRCNRVTVADPPAELAKLLADFVDRFGAAPAFAGDERSQGPAAPGIDDIS